MPHVDVVLPGLAATTQILGVLIRHSPLPVSEQLFFLTKKQYLDLAMT